MHVVKPYIHIGSVGFSSPLGLCLVLAIHCVWSWLSHKAATVPLTDLGNSLAVKPWKCLWLFALWCEASKVLFNLQITSPSDAVWLPQSHRRLPPPRCPKVGAASLSLAISLCLLPVLAAAVGTSCSFCDFQLCNFKTTYRHREVVQFRTVLLH